MLFAQIGRYSTLGVYVTFRLENTLEFLWKAPMKILPSVDHQVGHRMNSDPVETWYKVEAVKWEFEREQGEFGDPPQPFIADHSNFGVCCLISEIV